jgi:hypothetical protein
MSALTIASRTIARVAADLQAAITSVPGPEPRQLRQAADGLFDAAGQLLATAGDIEMGIES